MDFLSGVADLVAPVADRYWDSPAAWVSDCLLWGPGEGPTAYQLEILERLPVEKRVAVRGPRGLGKTCLSSWAVLWFALTRDLAGVDWKVPTTAGGWRQLVKFTWPEIHKWARLIDWAKVGRGKFRQNELMTQSLRLSSGEAFAAASDNPYLIEGAHADQLLFVFDEAKAIPDGTWDSAEGTFSGAGASVGLDAFALAISTPGEPQGRFYAIHTDRKRFQNWSPRHVTLGETVAAGRLSSEWAEQQKSAWGADSAMYANHVLGDFASSDEDGVIALAAVERAQTRWSDFHADCDARHVCDPGVFTSVGVDPARSGPDKTVLALRHENQVYELRKQSKLLTTEVTGLVVGILDANGGKAVIDVIGIGAGVVDQVRADDRFAKQVVAFNASESTAFKDRSGELGFANCRSAAWWHLRELLEDDEIMLPPDDDLTADLTAPHWKVTPAGKIQVESKDDLRKADRLGRSTDVGDAVIQAFWLDAIRTKLVLAGPVGITGGSYWREAG